MKKNTKTGKSLSAKVSSMKGKSTKFPIGESYAGEMKAVKSMKSTKTKKK